MVRIIIIGLVSEEKFALHSYDKGKHLNSDKAKKVIATESLINDHYANSIVLQ